MMTKKSPIDTALKAALEAAAEIQLLSVHAHISAEALSYYRGEVADLETKYMTQRIADEIAKALQHSSMLGFVKQRERGFHDPWGPGLDIDFSAGVVSREALSRLTMALRAAQKEIVV